MSIKCLLSALGLSVAMSAASFYAQAAETVKVALGTDGFVHMPLFVALDGGMFKSMGSMSNW